MVRVVHHGRSGLFRIRLWFNFGRFVPFSLLLINFLLDVPPSRMLCTSRSTSAYHFPFGSPISLEPKHGTPRIRSEIIMAKRNLLKRMMLNSAPFKIGCVLIRYASQAVNRGKGDRKPISRYR